MNKVCCSVRVLSDQLSTQINVSFLEGVRSIGFFQHISADNIIDVRRCGGARGLLHPMALGVIKVACGRCGAGAKRSVHLYQLILRIVVIIVYTIARTVDHPNTRRRYKSSKENMAGFFGEESRLDHISTASIEQFKQTRRTAGVKGSTINRNMRFLAQIMKVAERERSLARSPFDLTKFFLNESRERRKPHILTWEEQEKLLTVTSPSNIGRAGS
jgi:hypothetical protein